MKMKDPSNNFSLLQVPLKVCFKFLENIKALLKKHVTWFLHLKLDACPPVNVKPLNAERLYLNAFSKYCKY